VDLRFGITLANRGVLLGMAAPRDLLRMADAAEACSLIDSVWAGDALFVNRRLDALTLLAAVAGRTERVLLGPACMGSFALREPRAFAYEWASLDVLSGGRTRLVACAGGGGDAAWQAESRALGQEPADRRRRMIEHMAVLRHLWTHDEAPFEGRFYRFSGVTLEPKPVQSPCPIWLTTNAQRLASGVAGAGGSDLALARVGRFADGWMTHSLLPVDFAAAWRRIQAAAAAAGRAGAVTDNALYHHINLAADADAALADSKRFLDLYYGANYSRERLQSWGSYGTPRQCIAALHAFRGTGCRRIALRISTMGDAMAQFRRLTEEVLPFVNEDDPA
jgi:alkanesulfonate monooxygenase SsuD/methylene tetrahydromethanopterin reductase-like flavin-dependent oxidoreductase (luciferase family)